MAAKMFSQGLIDMGQGLIAWKASGGSTIKAQLTGDPDADGGGYDAAVDPDGHEFLDDTSSYEIGSLTDPTLTLADPKKVGTTKVAFDATNDLTFASVPSGHTAEGVIIYKDTGSAGTSTLIAWCKFDDNVATDGSDITVVFDSGGVFEIAFDAS